MLLNKVKRRENNLFLRFFRILGGFDREELVPKLNRPKGIAARQWNGVGPDLKRSILDYRVPRPKLSAERAAVQQFYVRIPNKSPVHTHSLIQQSGQDQFFQNPAEGGNRISLKSAEETGR